jgi:hypothetical protein
LIYEDGRKYIGEFKNSLFDGPGTYFFANGDQVTGMWQEGKLISEADTGGQAETH